jgi:hypothetical protein
MEQNLSFSAIPLYTTIFLAQTYRIVPYLILPQQTVNRSKKYHIIQKDFVLKNFV